MPRGTSTQTTKPRGREEGRRSPKCAGQAIWHPKIFIFMLVPFESTNSIDSKYHIDKFRDSERFEAKISLSPSSILAGPAKTTTAWTRPYGKLSGSGHASLPNSSSFPTASFSEAAETFRKAWIRGYVAYWVVFTVLSLTYRESRQNL